MPSIGIDRSEHAEMGSGAELSPRLIPDTRLGPNNIFVRLQPGADRAERNDACWSG